MTLFRAIDIPSEEPVQYVGVYVLHWPALQPEVGFVPVELDDAISSAIDSIVEDLFKNRGIESELWHIEAEIREEWADLIHAAIEGE